MRILIAPDKFKGSLGAREVAENIAIGLREAMSNVQIQIVPVADGGEGTASVLCDALDGRWIECRAHDSLGRKIQAHYAWVESERIAIMEMSETAGLARLTADERDPLRASTFGVGEILLGAAKRGPREIIIGLGGSATNDGGFGMARALGYRFYDGKEKELRTKVTDLRRLRRIAVPENVTFPLIKIAADVSSPLLGKRGATRLFARQKGATPAQVESLEKALANLAEIAKRDLRCDFRNESGAGAAGGLGFGLMTFCLATMRSGFGVVAEKIQLEKSIRAADIVVTGEGRLDRQTLAGKVPAGVSRLARKNGKRVFAIVGRSSGDREVESSFKRVFTLFNKSKTEAECIQRAPELLRARAKELARYL
jgi:glycerate kinase